MTEKWKEKVRANIKKNFDFLMKDPITKRNWTCFTELDYTRKYKWAIITAWMDYDEDGEWSVYAYIGKQSKKCIMQEYGIDWDYPQCPDENELWDTEIPIGSPEDYEWLIEQFEEMEKYGLENLE